MAKEPPSFSSAARACKHAKTELISKTKGDIVPVGNCKKSCWLAGVNPGVSSGVGAWCLPDFLGSAGFELDWVGLCGAANWTPCAVKNNLEAGTTALHAAAEATSPNRVRGNS